MGLGKLDSKKESESVRKLWKYGNFYFELNSLRSSQWLILQRGQKVESLWGGGGTASYSMVAIIFQLDSLY